MGNNIIALTLFIFLTVLSYLLIKKRMYENRRFLKTIAIFLLTYKSIEILLGLLRKDYTYYPVEYSTIFYFFISFVTLFNIKKYLPAAAAGSFVSGFGYLITIIFNINNMLEMHKTMNNVTGFLIGMLSHSILYVLSLLYLAKYHFSYKKEYLRINAITIFIAIHAAIIANFIDFSSKYRFIYMLINNEIIPSINDNIILMIIYYIVVLIVYNLVIKLYFRLNNYVHKSENKDNEHVLEDI